MAGPVSIYGVGLATAAGLTAPATAAAVAAGINRYQQSLQIKSDGQPAVLALAPDEALPPPAEPTAKLPPRHARAVRLAGYALAEAVEAAASAGPLPLMLGAPAGADAEALLEALSTQASVTLDDTSRVFEGHRCAGLEALAASLALLEQGAPRVLLGGLDSPLDAALLADLDSQGRLLGEGVQDGFAPGEAAAFLLLGAAAKGDEIALWPPALADEPGRAGGDPPNLGQGLTAAVAGALEQGQRSAASVTCSLNGERGPAREWAAAMLRNGQELTDPLQLEHPADCIGDVGAAAAPALLALAALGLQQGSLADPCVLWCSDDGPRRGALLVGRPAQEPDDA